ncbi:hypothetical protein [Chryseobacterium wanjuense]
MADFYYSTDRKNWKEMAKDYKMIFDYRRLLWAPSLRFLIMRLKMWVVLWMLIFSG